MKDRIKDMSIYLTVIIFCFYFMPILIRDTGSAMFVLLLLIPLVIMIDGFVFGMKKGFDIIFPIVVGLLFIPTVFIYYNSSSWPYSIIFGGISLVASFIGERFYKK